MNLLTIISIAVSLLVGGLVQSILSKRKEKRIEKAKLIDEHNQIECEDCDLEYLKEEWKTTIQTQMHFNELILKFRSIVLSVFIAGLGVIYGLSWKLLLNGEELLIVLVLALVFWICCFLLDCFYYQKLLIGSVEHSKKFDENDYFKRKGLFGLTRRINFEVDKTTSKVLLWTYYILPLIALGVIVFLRLE